ncbi:hypothetical protein STEG23_001568, partial [Scotinomys teguina]
SASKAIAITNTFDHSIFCLQHDHDNKGTNEGCTAENIPLSSALATLLEFQPVKEKCDYEKCKRMSKLNQACEVNPTGKQRNEVECAQASEKFSLTRH